MRPKNLYPKQDLEFALREEIGNPALFTGRARELDFFLEWCEGAKRQISKSYALMARKRRGKTALVQRLYNILYTRNDPMLVPFYYRMPEDSTTELEHSSSFYRALVTQFLAFRMRRPALVEDNPTYPELRELVADDPLLLRDLQRMEQIVESGSSSTAYSHAKEAGHRISIMKDVRIIQFLDEFQFLDEYIYADNLYKHSVKIASGYQRTASSKVSPQIITGSYVGWLNMVIGRMVARYRRFFLDPFPPEEALAQVYNYSTVFQIPVTDETAAYIAELCQYDPYYIAALFQSNHTGRDLTSKEAIRDTMSFEVTDDGGEIRSMWMEYTWHAFSEVNDKNAKRIALYLARYGDEERTQRQIRNDLELNLTDDELEKLLFKLYRLDIIKKGSNAFHFKGLGDPIFEMVFRHEYQQAIETFEGKEDIIAGKAMIQEFKQQLKKVKGELSYRRGQVAEYRMVNRLLMAMIKEVRADELFRHVPEGLSFGPFTTIRKKSFHLDQDRWVEVDVFCQAEDPAHADLAIEVKDWETTVSRAQVEKFVRTKEAIEPLLSRPTGFLFHAEQGLSAELEAYLAENGIMCSG